MDDRLWMYSDSPQGLRRMDYCNKVQGFINFATSILRNFTDDGIRCPCNKCKSKKFLHQDVVTMHLLTKGFMEDFFKNFLETYNSRLRERYRDNPSTHLDFDSDLWMEVGSCGGPDKNRVYGLSNTTAENLRSARSVSTIRSSPSVSSTQFKEFKALKQQYE